MDEKLSVLRHQQSCIKPLSCLWLVSFAIPLLRYIRAFALRADGTSRWFRIYKCSNGTNYLNVKCTRLLQS